MRILTRGRRFWATALLFAGAVIAIPANRAYANSQDERAPITVEDGDETFKKEILEVEKGLNDLLIVDEDKKVHVRKELADSLPMPPAQIERMLQMAVKVGDDGKLYLRNPEQIRPFMPQIRGVLKSGLGDRLKELAKKSPEERRAEIEKMMHPGGGSTPGLPGVAPEVQPSKAEQKDDEDDDEDKPRKEHRRGGDERDGERRRPAEERRRAERRPHGPEGAEPRQGGGDVERRLEHLEQSVRTIEQLVRRLAERQGLDRDARPRRERRVFLFRGPEDRDERREDGPHMRDHMREWHPEPWGWRGEPGRGPRGPMDGFPPELRQAIERAMRSGEVPPELLEHLHRAMDDMPPELRQHIHEMLMRLHERRGREDGEQHGERRLHRGGDHENEGDERGEHGERRGGRGGHHSSDDEERGQHGEHRGQRGAHDERDEERDDEEQDRGFNPRELFQRLRKELHKRMGGDRKSDRHGERDEERDEEDDVAAAPSGDMADTVRDLAAGLQKVNSVMTQDDWKRLGATLQRLAKTIKAEDLKDQAVLMAKLQEAIAPEDMPRFIEIMGEVLASPEGRAAQKRMDKLVQRFEGFAQSDRGKRFEDGLQRMNGLFGDGEPGKRLRGTVDKLFRGQRPEQNRSDERHEGATPRPSSEGDPTRPAAARLY